MKMEVGDYIRTKDGQVGKVIEIKKRKELADKIYLDIRCNDEFYNVFVYDFDIKSHKKDIIELVEVGDYVNGCLIVEISKDPFIKGQINLWTNMIISEGEPFPNEYYKAKILEKDIETILTHEMYEQNCYKVGED